MSHIDKIQGFECVYKVCELLTLLSISFGMEPHLSLYAWLVCSMPNWYMKNLTWYQSEVLDLDCHRPRLIKNCVHVKGPVNSPHVRRRVGIWKWGLSHIDKIQGFKCVYKACELLLLLPIDFAMESHLSLYAWLVCLIPNWYIKI